MPLMEDTAMYIYTYPAHSTDNNIKVYEGTTVPSLYDFDKIFVDGDRIVNLADYITRKEASFDNIVQITYLEDNYLKKDIILSKFNEYYNKLELDAKFKGYYNIPQIENLLSTLKTTLIDLNIETYYNKDKINELFNNIDAYNKSQIDIIIKNMSDSIRSSNTDLDERIKLCVTLDTFNRTVQNLATKEEVLQIQEAVSNDILTIRSNLDNYVKKTVYETDKTNFDKKYMLVNNMTEYVKLVALKLMLTNYFTKAESDDRFLSKLDFNSEINKYLLKNDTTALLSDFITTATFDAFKTSTAVNITDIMNKFNDYVLNNDLQPLLDNKVDYLEYHNKIISIEGLFSSYYKAIEIDTLINDINDDINTRFNNVITMSDVLGELEPYATKRFVLDSIKDIPTASTIVLKDYLETKLTDIRNEIIPRFDDYAVKDTVDTQLDNINTKFNDYSTTTSINTKLLDLTNWRQAYSFEQGIYETIKWVKKNIRTYNVDKYNI